MCAETQIEQGTTMKLSKRLSHGTLNKVLGLLVTVCLTLADFSPDMVLTPRPAFADRHSGQAVDCW